MVFWSGVPSISMRESAWSQAAAASAQRVSKLFPAVSARRFFSAPSVPVALKATFTVSSGCSRVLNFIQATTLRPAISGKLWYCGNFE